MGKTASDKKVRRCPQCGKSYEVYPPNDLNKQLSLTKPSEKEAVSVTEVIDNCPNCSNPTTLYWYRQKIPFRVGQA